MSDDWFDETYRSNETTPAELDTRVLRAARSAAPAGRRFPPTSGRKAPARSALAVAATAVVAATVLFVAIPLFDRSGFETPLQSPIPMAGKDSGRRRSAARMSPREMEIPPPAMGDAAPASPSGLGPAAPDVLSRTAAPARRPSRPASAIPDVPSLQGASETAPPPATEAAPRMEAGPGGRARAPGAPVGGEAVAARRPATVLPAAPAAACIPNVLRGPLGGPGRADEARWCPNARGGIDVDFLWDGGMPCPSRLVFEDAAGARVVLEGNVLAAGQERYHCIRGRWTRADPPAIGARTRG